MRYLKDLEIENKRVFIRADLNVPLEADGTIKDERRLTQFLPTLKHAIERGARIVIASHLGSPQGKPDPALSLRPVAKRLSELLGRTVQLAPAPVGPEVEAMVKKLAPGDVLLLENLRFNPGEKANDSQFAAQLAKLGEVYINDAFGTAHRVHASIVKVPAHIRENGIGLLMQQELEYYDRALVRTKRPLCVVLGGSKVSTKFNALMHLAPKIDKLIIGGAMANTFLAAQGLQMGRSKLEQDLLPKVLSLLGQLARRDCKVYLPVDCVVAPSMTSKGLGRAVPVLEMPADAMALDIGPATSLLFKEALQTAETIVWNGPMGAFENEEFAKGTHDLVESIASAHAFKVVGGGDTDAAIHQMELDHKFDYISSGGGAFLTLLEGGTLPAIAALQD